MSSPIHHAEDLDEALHYAPPWAREQGRREPLRPAAQLVRSPQSLRRLDFGDQAFSGDLAMAKLQRQLALDPDAVPEPPVNDIESLWPMALRLCAVAGVAAAVAWLVISLPGTRLLRHDVVHADIQVPPPVADTQKQDPLRTPAAAGLLLQHGLSEANASPAPVEATPAPAPQPTIAPPSRWRIGVTDDAFSGDRAMVKLQRQLALDPDAVPEPPVDDIQSLWPMALRLCAVAGVRNGSCFGVSATGGGT